MDRTESPEPVGSQSKLSSALFWVLIGAVLFRIVTGVTDREEKGDTLVQWVPMEEAAATARTTSRPILYDFTAEWCAPCKVLDRVGWNDREIAALVNEEFAPARVLDRQREEGRNPPAVQALEERYRVVAFPTLIVASADGQEIARLQGFLGREALVQFLVTSRDKARGAAGAQQDQPANK